MASSRPASGPPWWASPTWSSITSWESLADREKKWNAFAADPEWHAKRAETEKDGAIVANVSNQFLMPTAFSSVK
jgi:NIPSNAP